MVVEVINKSPNELPQYANVGDSGVDLRADFTRGHNDKFMNGSEWDDVLNKLIIFPGGKALIPTGLFTAFPVGYEIQIRSRSGLALKSGIIVLNSPATIDANYRNELGVILFNISDEVFYVSQGDRIAQAVLCPVKKIEWKIVDSLDTTGRNLSGFGDSGIK